MCNCCMKVVYSGYGNNETTPEKDWSKTSRLQSHVCATVARRAGMGDTATRGALGAGAGIAGTRDGEAPDDSQDRSGCADGTAASQTSESSQGSSVEGRRYAF